MVSITCPCIECIYNGRGYKCTAKAINLKYRNMATVYEGRIDMWICDKYELSEDAKQMQEFLNNIQKGKKNEIKENIIAEEDRLNAAIRHINTALDIDHWAQRIAVESIRMRIAMLKEVYSANSETLTNIE